MDYVPKESDAFSHENIISCGLDMEYTGLNADFELPEEMPGYKYSDDITNLDSKLKQDRPESNKIEPQPQAQDKK